MDRLHYLNTPALTIPEDFQHPTLFYESKVGDGYTSYLLEDTRILDQIKNIFPEFVVESLEGIYVQVLTVNFNCKTHIDPRTIAINYILESGGDVETYFLNPEVRHQIRPGAWHWFYVNQSHGIRNMSSTRRSITMSIKHNPSEETLAWLLQNS